MKQTPKLASGREPRKQTSQVRSDRPDREAMSSSMRQLIMSFGEADSERTWDPTAYSRRTGPAR